jgi:hypothetical protein
MTHKEIIIKIINSRLNESNLFVMLLIERIDRIDNCEALFEDFLTYTFASAEARDYWRNKLK